MSLKWRVILGLLVLVAAVIKIAPNFIDTDNMWWPAKGKIVYGLDIQGGVHLVMGIDNDAVMAERMQRTLHSLEEGLLKKDLQLKGEVTNSGQYEMKVKLEGSTDVATVQKYIEDYYPQTLQILDASGDTVTFKLFDLKVAEFKKQIVDQAIEVIRNRIDEFGVAEPSIAAQGDSRILVQLPGIKDAERAKELINRTARLDFRIVSQELKPEELQKLVDEAEKAGDYALGKDGLTYTAYVKRMNADLKDKLPQNTMVAFEKLPNATTMEAGKMPMLLKTDERIGGDQLEDASVSFDEFGKPEVAFRLGVEGRAPFGELTEKNVGKLLAIVLDDVIQSAPVLNSRIDEAGRIQLNQRNYEEALNEAKMIAMTLRAGALPATLEQLEERTVGPTLGAESIAKAKVAGYVSFALIGIFLMAYYGALGVIATLALSMNVICLLALLTGLGATLTLPGIAGIILTLGMAVDSNVIIYERIKEEFRKGASMKMSVRDGFQHAYSAIIDSNVTGVAVALILFYYGTGPVRGFAVTLVSGIVTSMFTAIFIARILIDAMGDRLHLKRA